MVQSRAYFSTNVPLLFGVQGLLGSLACGIIRAFFDNAQWRFNYGLLPFPFRWDVTGEFFRACFISFGIALGSGLVVGLFVWLVSGMEKIDYFEDRAFWITSDDGIRTQKGEAREEQ